MEHLSEFEDLEQLLLYAEKYNISMLSLLLERTRTLQKALKMIDNIVDNFGEEVPKAMRFYIKNNETVDSQTAEENFRMTRCLLLWKAYIAEIICEENLSPKYRPDYERFVEEMEQVLREVERERGC